MIRRKTMAILAGAVMAATCSNAVLRAATVDGTLDSSYGAVLSTQTNTSNTGDVNGDNGARTNSQNQLSNAYGQIDTANNQLDLFFGGAINLDNEYLHLAIDANPTTGVANLSYGAHTGTNDTGNVSNFSGFGAGSTQTVNGQTVNGAGGNLYQTTFDAGFRPETLLTFQFNGGNIIYDDNLLTGTEYKDDYGADPQNGPVTRGPAAGDAAGGVNLTVAVNNALSGTLETAATAASATTGFEIALNLSDLGYVAGSPINAAAFITQGSGTTMTNQVLGPNPGDASDPYFQYNFDFTAEQGPGGHNADGNQYFTVPAPVAAPEPVSMGLLFLGGSMLIRRSRSN